jgi:hypothetical protein
MHGVKFEDLRKSAHNPADKYHDYFAYIAKFQESENEPLQEDDSPIFEDLEITDALAYQEFKKNFKQ